METETNYDSAWGQWLRDLGGAAVRNWMQTQSPNGTAPVKATPPPPAGPPWLLIGGALVAVVALVVVLRKS